jgi:hypothetical protein
MSCLAKRSILWRIPTNTAVFHNSSFFVFPKTEPANTLLEFFIFECYVFINLLFMINYVNHDDQFIVKRSCIMINIHIFLGATTNRHARAICGAKSALELRFGDRLVFSDVNHDEARLWGWSLHLACTNLPRSTLCKARCDKKFSELNAADSPPVQCDLISVKQRTSSYGSGAIAY